jgi:uncharacterized repeat protein (TIGR02543 family)
MKNLQTMKAFFTNFLLNTKSVFLFICLFLGMNVVWGQTYYNMASGDYSQSFADIANWTNNYAAGIGASNWKVAATATGSSVNTGTVFVSSVTGGVQKGTQSLIILATGTNSSATDLLLNLSGRTAGTLSLDWVKVENTANASPRSSDLKIQYSTDGGSNFTDITGYTIPRILNNSTAQSGSLSSITLPAALNNQSTVVLRFYVWNNSQTGGSGNRPKWQLDNISVTSTATATNYSVTFNANGGSGTMTNQTASSATALTSNTFTRTGYSFSGWNTAANGSATAYTNGASFPFTANTTLYAQWTPNTLNITYDAQGGSSISSGTTSTGASIASSPGTPTRAGYTFNGWFVASSGGSALSFPYTHGQTSDFTLYAQWTSTSSNNCPTGTSTAPTTEQTVCQDISTSTIATTVSYSGGTGTPTDSYQWYYNTTNSNTISGATSVSGATSASFSPPSTSNEVGTRYYFCVAYATDNSCAQSATTQSLASSTVKIVVNGIPAAPTGSATQSMCTGQTVSNLNATGTAIQWYSASSGGSALNSSSALTSTDYYASQTVNGCESSNRLAVAATVNTIPAAPTGTAAQTFCSGNTVSNLNATGTAIKWYSASSGGSALTGTSALSSTSYYASQTVSGCESSNRLAVAATVNSISIPTNLVSSNANCSSFDLAWDAVNCATGYKLDVASNSSFLSNSFSNIVSWDFPNNPDNSIADGGVVTNSAKTLTVVGATGTLSYTTITGGTTSLASLSGWNSGSGVDYWQVDFSTMGYYNTRFSSLQRSSNTGPKDFKVQYKIGAGGTWTDLSGAIVTVANDFTTGQLTNIPLPSICDNKPSVYLRWIMTSNTAANLSTVALLGTSAIDNIFVEGNAAAYVSGYQDLSITSNSTSISGLSPNTKYYYRVRSTDGTNTSASSIVDSVTTPVLSFTTDGIIAPFCFGTATSSSLTYTAANDNPNSYSVDWNATANTAGLNDQAATSFTSSASGGTISSIAISSNLPAGTYNGIMTITNTAGCSITKNVSLTINALPAITIAATPTSAIVCSGSNVSLTASGASTYSWSGGISNGSSFSVTSPTSYTVTGTDANGCSATATKTVNYYPASSNVVLASASVSGAVEQCTESDGYTYYADPASPGQYLFGINKNGNSFSATVDITVDNVNKFKKSTSSNGANQEHASYILSRFWNVNATGTISNPVKVRFFIEPQDISDLLDARDDDLDTLKINNPSTKAVISGFEWFKTSGISYNPSSWNGNKFNSTLVKLTEDTVATINGQWYVELSGITSFSGGTGGAAFGPSSNNLFNSSGIVGLPVTWKEVNAIAKEMGNQIQWSTSSEKNTKSFEVEYSYDAKNFIKASKEIKAAGNSSTTNSYEYTHLEEFGEMVYYRIKQLDLDGKMDYSKIVNVKRTSKLPAFQVSMYPIPLNVKDLNIRIQTVQKTNIAIIINDLLGRSVYTETISPTGYTTDQKLDLSHLTQGTYYVTINNGVNKTVQVLVVGK